ncbi:hypothetical protein KSP40_PGU021196 [Platanthera guangdongensis]|uniref:Uncharacterized protein n=1 Tax=Platanthera guangdongensis TaxID=2320717 RepID=A0ABR2LQ18_9ASPA
MREPSRKFCPPQLHLQVLQFPRRARNLPCSRQRPSLPFRRKISVLSSSGYWKRKESKASKSIGEEEDRRRESPPQRACPGEIHPKPASVNCLLLV